MMFIIHNIPILGFTLLIEKDDINPPAPARYFVHLGQRISAGLWSNATRDTGRMISALFFLW